MAIDTARLTQRLGKLVGWLNEVNAYRGTTLIDRVDDVYAQYATVNPDLVGSLYSTRDAAVRAMDGQLTYVRNLAASVIIDEVENDRPLPASNITEALKEWRRQLVVAADSFNATPASITPATVAATGNPTLVTSGKDGTGQEQDLILPDVYLLTCTADKDSSGTKWAETFTIRGKASDAAATDYGYPSGTGVNTTVTVVNPALSTGGVVTDGTFATWDGGTPNSLTAWTAGSGNVFATHLTRVADDPRDGASGTCLSMKGDGTVIPSVKQAVTVRANTVYAVHARLKKANDPGSDWKVTVRLVDGSGAVLSSDTTLTSAAAGSVTADWANTLSGVFITPTTLPASVYLEVVFHDTAGVTTAPVNLAEVYVDHLHVRAVDPLYVGGPRVVLFSGTTASVREDAYTVTVTVAGTYKDYLLPGIARLVPEVRTFGSRLPTDAAAAETILDSLVS
jgi:hypothetical protein